MKAGFAMTASDYAALTGHQRSTLTVTPVTPPPPRDRRDVQSNLEDERRTRYFGRPSNSGPARQMGFNLRLSF